MHVLAVPQCNALQSSFHPTKMLDKNHFGSTWLMVDLCLTFSFQQFITLRSWVLAAKFISQRPFLMNLQIVDAKVLKLRLVADWSSFGAHFDVKIPSLENWQSKLPLVPVKSSSKRQSKNLQAWVKTTSCCQYNLGWYPSVLLTRISPYYVGRHGYCYIKERWQVVDM